MNAIVQGITEDAFTAAAGFMGDFAPLVYTMLGLALFLIISKAFFSFLR